MSFYPVTVNLKSFYFEPFKNFNSVIYTRRQMLFE
jgi:hypothetical protein